MHTAVFTNSFCPITPICTRSALEPKKTKPRAARGVLSFKLSGERAGGKAYLPAAFLAERFLPEDLPVRPGFSRNGAYASPFPSEEAEAFAALFAARFPEMIG